MPTDLERLLSRMESVPEAVERRVDLALNSAPECPAIVTTWNRYRLALAEFYRHAESVLLSAKELPPLNVEWHAGRCWQLLRKELGDSAPQAGFEMARTGNEKGMLGLRQRIARQMAKECSQRLVDVSVGIYWSARSAEELVQDSDEYLEKYGHLLPPEMTEGGAHRIRFSFRKVLREHPAMMRRMREVARQQSGGIARPEDGRRRPEYPRSTLSGEQQKGTGTWQNRAQLNGRRLPGTP